MPSTRPGSSASNTSVPCTCFNHKGSEGASARSRFRFVATSAASSSVCRPRFRPDHGPVLTPPQRVVQKYSTPFHGKPETVVKVVFALMFPNRLPKAHVERDRKSDV